ncbi:MAG TPA: hypothetical protein VGJ28_27225, partial [Micromonosporaceae bacterium]
TMRMVTTGMPDPPQYRRSSTDHVPVVQFSHSRGSLIETYGTCRLHNAGDVNKFPALPSIGIST